MAENESGTVMLPPAKTQEAFVHIGFAKARLTRGRAFVLAILAGAFVALGASFMLMVRSDASLALFDLAHPGWTGILSGTVSRARGRR